LATIYDIANEAGVSIATVSRVFNNSKSVSEKTRVKILEIADRVGYHPKAFAQGLARKNSNIIMALVPVISNYFFMEVLGGIQDKLAQYNYDLNIFNITSDNSEQKIAQQVEYVLKKGMADGYMLISIHQDTQYWQRLKSLDVPVVLVDEYHQNFDSVSVDSVEGAYEATSYLITKGFKTISMISASPNAKPIIDRVKGYKRALEDSGRLVNPKYIVTGDESYRDGFTEEGGYQAMKTILHNFPEVDACFCASDIQALGAMKAMRESGKLLPLIGFDDIPLAQYVGISTMRQPMYDMGSLALEKLINRISSPQSNISHTVFSPELVIREQNFEPVID
jgi:LacI family transcriptional regulator